MGASVCGRLRSAHALKLTFDDEYQHETTDAALACPAYPIIPSRPAGYWRLVSLDTGKHVPYASERIP